MTLHSNWILASGNFVSDFTAPAVLVVFFVTLFVYLGVRSERRKSVRKNFATDVRSSGGTLTANGRQLSENSTKIPDRVEGTYRNQDYQVSVRRESVAISGQISEGSTTYYYCKVAIPVSVGSFPNFTVELRNHSLSAQGAHGSRTADDSGAVAVGNPVFDDAFLLFADEPSAVRRCFPSSLTDWLARNPCTTEYSRMIVRRNNGVFHSDGLLWVEYEGEPDTNPTYKALDYLHDLAAQLTLAAGTAR